MSPSRSIAMAPFAASPNGGAGEGPVGRRRTRRLPRRGGCPMRARMPIWRHGIRAAGAAWVVRSPREATFRGTSTRDAEVGTRRARWRPRDSQGCGRSASSIEQAGQRRGRTAGRSISHATGPPMPALGATRPRRSPSTSAASPSDRWRRDFAVRSGCRASRRPRERQVEIEVQDDDGPGLGLETGQRAVEQVAVGDPSGVVERRGLVDRRELDLDHASRGACG